MCGAKLKQHSRVENKWIKSIKTEAPPSSGAKLEWRQTLVKLRLYFLLKPRI